MGAVHANNYHHRARSCKESIPSPRRRCRGKGVVARKLRRKEVLTFFAKLPPCLVGIEACGSAHYWGREIGNFGHTVMLMPPRYVKAYVKPGKIDAIDAAAICEAVTRPSMSFVPVKGLERPSRRGSPRRAIAICAHYSLTARWPLYARRRDARTSIPWVAKLLGGVYEAGYRAPNIERRRARLPDKKAWRWGDRRSGGARLQRQSDRNTP